MKMNMKGRGLRSDTKQSDDLQSKRLVPAIGSGCARCGGLLVRDAEFSLSIERKIPSLRCIQCGEWIDELILLNRRSANKTECTGPAAQSLDSGLLVSR